MSMEHGVSTQAPKAAAKAGHHAGGHGAAKAQAAVPGDFAALLMGLGEQELPAPDVLSDAGAAALAAQPAVPQAPVDPALPTDASPCALGLPQAALPAAPEAADLPGQARGAGEGLSAVGVATPAASAWSALAHRADQRAAQAGEQPGAAEAASRKLEASALADAASAPAAASAAAGDELQPLLRQAQLAQRMAQHRSDAAELAVQAGKAPRGEDLAARLGWRISEPLAPVGSPLLVAAGEAGLRPLERRSERRGPGLGGVGEAGAWSGVPQPDAPRVDVPAVAPDGGLTTEMRVAEQVSYWIGRGAQNAELEVDGLGEGPVKVSIELQGQEARVEFRADQAQTRQILQDSMPHLRELLEREGLVLSGLSVGMSGSERGQGGQSSEDRPGHRPGRGEGPELPALARVASAQRAAPLSGRSVDLFV